MTRLVRSWPLTLLIVLAMAPGVYAQTTDESGRGPQVDRPALPTNPQVDLVFTPVTPCRVFDTRPATRGPGSITNVPAAAFAACGVPIGPTGASAVAINVTAAQNFLVSCAAGDLRVGPVAAPVPPSSLVNYQNCENVANAADIPLGAAGIFVFVDVSATDFIVDVNGYYNDVACQAGTVKALGQCFETGLRAATTVFSASDICRGAGLPGGGRLATGLQLRSLRGGNPLTLAAAPGEWVDSVYVNGAAFQAMTIENGGGFDNQTTIANRQFRCVFNPLP
jgi:hypothetical protein